MDEPGGRIGAVPRDVTRLVVGRAGRIQRCTDPPGALLLDAAGTPVLTVDEFLRSLSAGGAPATTVYSYASALLRWWRFLAAVEVPWDRVSRVEVRDFVLWLRFTPKGSTAVDGRDGARATMAGSGYAPATINHNLAVLLSFYDERLTAASGPVVNPVPSATGRDGERPGAITTRCNRSGRTGGRRCARRPRRACHGGCRTGVRRAVRGDGQ
jgi:hypothetical protein